MSKADWRRSTSPRRPRLRSGNKVATLGGNQPWITHTIALKTEPTKLGFSTPARTGVVNDCLGPITVQTQNTAASPCSPLSATEVGLASGWHRLVLQRDAAATTALDAGRSHDRDRTRQASPSITSRPTAAPVRIRSPRLRPRLTQAQQTQAVKLSQTITFAGPSSPQVYGDTVDIGPATSDSGLTVTVTPSGGCGPLTGSNTTITSATTDCTLTATQAGDSSYDAATPVVRTIVTDPRPITVTADSGQSKVYSNNAATDPVFTKQVTSGNLVGTDTFTGALARTAGETVAGSPYAINAGHAVRRQQLHPQLRRRGLQHHQEGPERQRPEQVEDLRFRRSGAHGPAERVRLGPECG